ncbi:MAG: sulfite reductase subunit beta, partial [Pseudomonadota bacterium]
RFGWVEGVDGRHHLTLYILSGRIKDLPQAKLKTGLRKIAEHLRGDPVASFRMTANQNLIIAGVAPEDRAEIEALAREHGLLSDLDTPQLRHSMACVALPTCPLAMAEAERFLPELVAGVDAILARHGVADDPIVLRVVGCPNGCGRAMLAEAGLVGKGPGTYNLYLGGNRVGTRIPKLHLENKDAATILAEFDRLIGLWSVERIGKEGFGDFVIRAGIVAEVKVSKTDFHA